MDKMRLKNTQGNAMYHAVYNVFNEKPSYKITEGYQRWLK